MTLQGGDREFGHGDQVTVTNNTGSTIAEGLAVSVTGDAGEHPLVDLADTDSAGQAVAIMGDELADGEYKEAVFHGAVWARVDSAVSAGDEVGAPAVGTAGTAGVLEASSGTGYYALSDPETRDDGNDYAIVHLG